jgi:hypothetical protein
VYSEITGESAWQVLFRPPSLAIGHQNLTHVDSGLLISRTFLPCCRKFLYFTFLVFSVLYTKYLLKSTHLIRYSTTFLSILQFNQNWVITEVLVCPFYAFYEFIVLANSIRLKWLRWSRGCVLASSIQVRGFKPGRSRRIFQCEKIPSTPFFAGEVKPAAPCRRFAACKRSLNVTWKSAFRQNSRLLFLAH